MKMLVLTVEGIAGSTAQNIARDMIALSVQLDLMVTCNVNGAMLLAVPSSAGADLELQYKREVPDAAP